MSDTSKNVLALLVGAAIGAGVGILFAPDKGSKTREKIKGSVDDLKHQAQDKWNSVKGFTKEDLKGTINNLISSSGHKAEESISFLEEKLAELKSQTNKFPK